MASFPSARDSPTKSLLWGNLVKWRGHLMATLLRICAGISSEKPTQDSLSREVRITQRTRTEVTGTEEKIIEVVVSEFLRLSEGRED
jgi:hypothetical protein